MKMSVYCVEVEGTTEGDLVVMNTERGFLRAAVMVNGCVARWLGRECKGDEAPRRHAQQYAEVLGYWK
jgi:hypothetical protein